MTRRWWAAAVVPAGLVFVMALLRPEANPLPMLEDAGPIVAALFWAVMAIVWVWFVEGMVTPIRRLLARKQTRADSGK